MGVEKITLIIAIVGTASGLFGTVLGVINLWDKLRRDAIRLKIKPFYAVPVGAINSATVNFGIEVVNLSEFAVTITDVGFVLNNDKIATLAPVDGIDRPHALPVRLEPRTSYKKLFHTSIIKIGRAKIKSAYANTECGETLTGTSNALKQIANEVNIDG